MKKNQIILIIVGIILLVLGFCLGGNWSQNKIGKIKTESPLVDLLSSKIINGLTTTASGEVTEMSDRNLTLSSEGNTLTIPIRKGVSIYRLAAPKVAETPQSKTREEIEFEEIKVGDKVNITCQLKEDGSLEGIDVTVLP